MITSGQDVANIFVNLFSKSGTEQENDIKQHGFVFYLESLPK